MTRRRIGLLVILGLGLLVARLAAHAQEPAPSLSLSLNQESFRRGETLVLTATVTAGAPRAVDVYVVLERPDGRPWLFYQADGRFTEAPQPLVRNWTVAPFTGVLFRHPLSACELGGSYRWLAAFTEPDSSTLLVSPAQAPFALETPRLIQVSGNNQTGRPGEVLPEPFVVRVEDQFGQPIPGCAVTFSRLVGDGTFVGSSAALAATQSPWPGGAPSLAAPQQTAGASVTVVTGADGLAAARYQPGQEPLQIVAAQAQGAPTAPVIFRVNLGPLAGNGLLPVNIAVGGARVYVANALTNNISVLDATGQSGEVVAVIDLKERLRTPFGAGSTLGVAVNTAANRLYAYALHSDTVTGGNVVLLAVDTATNQPVEPSDPDRDGRPGLTLFSTPPPSAAGLFALSPGQILGGVFGNLVAVDEGRGGIYAVIPGTVEVDAAERPVTIAPGGLIVIDGRSDALAVVAHIGVGEAPTGVAVNPGTNRIYVTNRGYPVDDGPNDSVTVIDGNIFAVSATIPVGQVPLGAKVDTRNHVIYVSNFYGEVSAPGSGAVSVIDGRTDQVVQTVPTSGTTDLAVLVGGESALLPAGLDRIYVNDAGGTIVECHVANLSVPAPCQIRPELSAPLGSPKFALHVSHGLLFGARHFDSSALVFDLARHGLVADILLGIAVRGLDVDVQTGVIYGSDFSTRGRIFAIMPDGEVLIGDLNPLRPDLGVPGQVEVDEATGRLYVISPNSTGGAAGIPPLIALNRGTGELAAALEPQGWEFGAPQALAIDARRNLLYIAATTNRLLVFDGTRLQGNTEVNAALLADLVAGSQDNTELVQGVAVDAEQNLVYVTRCGYVQGGGCGETGRSALIVVRGPELDAATRTLVRAPAVVATLPGVGLTYGGGRRDIALDLQSNLIYVAGAPGCIVGSNCRENGQGFGSTDITVVDGSRMAVLGVIPIKRLPGVNIPITADYSSLELAFNATERLLYVVTKSSAHFTEGLISVIDGNRVIDGARSFITTPHPNLSGALASLMATIPAGVDPQFIALDTLRNRVVVSNQSLGALSILQGLSRR
jgi:YVTN family beta-propeller protein